MNLTKTITHGGVKHTVRRKARGLGDVVAHVLHTGPLGIVVKAVTGMSQPCGNCTKRVDKLNELVSFENTKKLDKASERGTH